MSSTATKLSRPAMVAAAAQILDSGAYADLTVESLAAHLHMSKSTLYKYFSGKDSLMRALIDSTCARTDRDLAALKPPTSGARTGLRRVLEVHADHMRRLPRAVVLQEDRLPQPCQDRMDTCRHQLRLAYAEATERGVERGDFLFADPALAAHAFAASSEAALLAVARGELVLSYADVARWIGDLLLPGLAAPTAD